MIRRVTRFVLSASISSALAAGLFRHGPAPLVTGQGNGRTADRFRTGNSAAGARGDWDGRRLSETDQ